ncbi:MAG TPA: DUF1801 domain-containing protein [Herpetosiphonaceae bacterium]|nr:DUF1801 domain-containing protein [Herpetosiphonaceae bacterium]
MSDGFDEIMVDVDPHIAELALRTRTLIRDVYPVVVEVPWPKQRVIGYGVGPRKMSEHFCYISVSGNHVNLGFNYGSELPDPDHLLEGTGKLFRHVKVHGAAQLDNPALRRLLEAASRHRMPASGVTDTKPSHNRF